MILLTSNKNNNESTTLFIYSPLVPRQRFRPRSGRVREADRDMFGHAGPRRLTYYQFAITDGGVVLGLGGQSKMIPKSFLKSFKIAVII